MSRGKVFLSSILAGMCIGFGGVVFLSVENKVIGTVLFTIGLFVICTFGFHLFTGKVCYAFQNDRRYALDLPLIWVGNLLGTGCVAGIVSLTRNAAALSEKAMALCKAKLDDSFLSLFLLGVLCNIFIYIAVEGFKVNKHELGKYLSLFFGVTVFILAGTEHCVADMFYFWMAGAWSVSAVLRLVMITLGNIVGGCGFCLLRELADGSKS
ncbi:MAG: formate/nitrite transporter family protein [Oscillospiraceae bacterium]|nr:formate/nitrite transporter family protein [Oscillospiraceae bacterium]